MFFNIPLLVINSLVSNLEFKKITKADKDKFDLNNLHKGFNKTTYTKDFEELLSSSQIFNIREKIKANIADSILKNVIKNDIVDGSFYNEKAIFLGNITKPPFTDFKNTDTKNTDTSNDFDKVGFFIEKLPYEDGDTVYYSLRKESIKYKNNTQNQEDLTYSVNEYVCLITLKQDILNSNISEIKYFFAPDSYDFYSIYFEEDFVDDYE